MGHVVCLAAFRHILFDCLWYFIVVVKTVLSSEVEVVLINSTPVSLSLGVVSGGGYGHETTRLGFMSFVLIRISHALDVYPHILLVIWYF